MRGIAAGASLVAVALATAATGTDGRATPEREVQGLPLPALAAGSAAIGRDDVRFHARHDGRAVRLDNRRHDLRARLTGRGLELGDGVRVTLAGIGRGDRPAPPVRGAAETQGNRVVLDRGSVEEWYVNGPLGLEQGFTVQRRPRGDGPVRVRLGLHGTRVAALDRDRRGATLDGGIAYRGLWAGDARGRRVPARMDRAPGGLQLVVDDRDAVYPLTIDPIFQQSRLSTSDDGPLSGAVAADGGTIAFGAALAGGTKGVVYVFQRPAAGWSPTLTESARLVASDGAGGDRLGASVAVGAGGATIAAGAPLAKVGSDDERGAVYVFERPAGGWSGTIPERQKLLTTTGAARDRLGSAVALHGDELVAGAAERANKLGAAYLFTRAADGAWAQAAELVPSGTRVGNDQFGITAALGDGFAAVGTLNPGNASPGSVWVFDRPGGGWGGTVLSTQRVQASDGVTGTRFGAAVAVQGTTLVAGADESGRGGRGAAYVFEREGGSFVQRAKLTAADGVSGDQFGSAVAIAGDRVAVGARLDDIGTNDSQGSVHLFRRPAAGWGAPVAAASKIFPADGQAVDLLGSGVALAGPVVAAPASNGTTARGAWLFGEDDTPPATTIAIPPPDGTEGWHRTPVTITVTADDGPDGAGAVITRCVLDAPLAPVAFEELTAGCAIGRGAVVATEGGHVVHAASRDGVGNTEPVRAVGFRIDSTPPTVRCGPVPTFLRGSTGGRVTATVSDALSGPSAAVASAAAATGRTGAHKVVVTGADRAGNTATAECGYDVVASGLPFCGTDELLLTDARIAGRKRPRVRLHGIARQRLAGERVELRAGRRVVATATVRRDGRFSALADRPRRRTSFRAHLGAQRSDAVTYDPRLTAGRERRRGRTTTVDVRARGARTIVLTRRTGCDRRRRAGRVRVSRRGITRVRLRNALSDVALYELRVTVRGRTVRIPVAAG